MTTRTFTNLCQIAAAMGAICATSSLAVAAQSLKCPMPHTLNSPGVLKESPTQVAKTGSFLASGDSDNRTSEVVADLRKRYPGVANAEIENYLVTAYCPIVAKRDGLGVAEQQARLDRFARQASVAVYGH